MIGHPPTTYLGFTGFVIPYAFAISALLTGKSRSDEWIHQPPLDPGCLDLSFHWIGAGRRWAYDALGWGGFWAWDPVENAMLMPWLTGTAFLHSVMMTEKRGMPKHGVFPHHSHLFPFALWHLYYPHRRYQLCPLV